MSMVEILARQKQERIYKATADDRVLTDKYFEQLLSEIGNQLTIMDECNRRYKNGRVK